MVSSTGVDSWRESRGLPIPCAVPSRLPEAASEDRWDEAAGLPLDVVAYIAPHDPGADGTVAILP
jgi:hypothetical protein